MPFTPTALREMATCLMIEAARTDKIHGMSWKSAEFRAMATKLRREATTLDDVTALTTQQKGNTTMSTTTLQNEAKHEVGKLGWLLLFTPPIILIRAWTLTMLWNWYFVPGFGAQPLQMIYAFGIMVIVAFLTPTRKREDESVGRIVVMAIGGSLMSLLFGWIGTFFM